MLRLTAEVMRLHRIKNEYIRGTWDVCDSEQKKDEIRLKWLEEKKKTNEDQRPEEILGRGIHDNKSIYNLFGDKHLEKFSIYNTRNLLLF